MRRPRLVAGVVLVALAFAGGAHAGGPLSSYYASDTEGIFWFVHVSDLHIDTNAPVARDHLRFVLTEVVDVIAPVAVFASGDLVNGTILGIPTSGQDSAEWDLYETLLLDANVTSDFYFDVPGNHDAYGDHGLTHYIESSLQGRATNGRLFTEATFTTPLGEYYFVGMNSTGTYATPFSFGNPAFTNVKDLAAGLDAHKDSQLVFVFAHHHLVEHGNTDPQLVLGIGGKDDPPDNVDDVLPLLEGAGAFYLHGHIHQYKEGLQGGVVTVQVSSLAHDPEVDRSSLEAWDLTKHQSNIGVGIVDHNAFVYRTTDTSSPWPFVAITAPVDVNLQGGGTPPGSSMGISFEGDYLAYGAQKNPYAYDVCVDGKVNPVRALVLSKAPLSSVSLLVDDSVVGPMTSTAGRPGIYTTTMDASGLEPGLHAITVTAVAGNEVRSDSIQVNFTSDSCAPMGDAGADAPLEDASPPQEAGVDAGAEPGVDLPLEADESVSEAGCSCGVTESGPPLRPAVGALGFLALGLLLLRRRRQRVVDGGPGTAALRALRRGGRAMKANSPSAGSLAPRAHERLRGSRRRPHPWLGCRRLPPRTSGTRD